MSYFRRGLIERIQENLDFLIFIFQHLAKRDLTKKGAKLSHAYFHQNDNMSMQFGPNITVLNSLFKLERFFDIL